MPTKPFPLSETWIDLDNHALGDVAIIAQVLRGISSKYFAVNQEHIDWHSLYPNLVSSYTLDTSTTVFENITWGPPNSAIRQDQHWIRNTPLVTCGAWGVLYGLINGVATYGGLFYQWDDPDLTGNQLYTPRADFSVLNNPGAGAVSGVGTNFLTTARWKRTLGIIRGCLDDLCLMYGTAITLRYMSVTQESVQSPPGLPQMPGMPIPYGHSHAPGYENITVWPQGEACEPLDNTWVGFMHYDGMRNDLYVTPFGGPSPLEECEPFFSGTGVWAIRDRGYGVKIWAKDDMVMYYQPSFIAGFGIKATYSCAMTYTLTHGTGAWGGGTVPVSIILSGKNSTNENEDTMEGYGVNIAVSGGGISDSRLMAWHSSFEEGPFVVSYSGTPITFTVSMDLESGALDDLASPDDLVTLPHPPISDTSWDRNYRAAPPYAYGLDPYYMSARVLVYSLYSRTVASVNLRMVL